MTEEQEKSREDRDFWEATRRNMVPGAFVSFSLAMALSVDCGSADWAQDAGLRRQAEGYACEIVFG